MSPQPRFQGPLAEVPDSPVSSPAAGLHQCPSEPWSSVPRTLPAFQTLLTLIPSSKAGLPLSPLHSQVPWGLRGSRITFPRAHVQYSECGFLCTGIFLGFSSISWDFPQGPLHDPGVVSLSELFPQSLLS